MCGFGGEGPQTFRTARAGARARPVPARARTSQSKAFTEHHGAKVLHVQDGLVRVRKEARKPSKWAPSGLGIDSLCLPWCSCAISCAPPAFPVPSLGPLGAPWGPQGPISRLPALFPCHFPGWVPGAFCILQMQHTSGSGKCIG